MSATKKLRAGIAVVALVGASFGVSPSLARAEYCGSGSYCGGYSSGSYNCGSSYCGSGGYSSGSYGSYDCGSSGYYCGSSRGYSSGSYSGGSSMSTGQIVGLVDTGIKALSTIFGSTKVNTGGTVKTGVDINIDCGSLTGIDCGETETVKKKVKVVKDVQQVQIPSVGVVSDQTPTEIIRVIRPAKRALADTGANS